MNEWSTSEPPGSWNTTDADDYSSSELLLVSESPSPSNETKPYNLPHSLAWFICVPFVLIVISLVTIIGNSLVIAAYARDQRIRVKVPNTLILNLSITDLLIGIFIIPINTVYISLDRWPFGELACKAWLTLDYSLCLVSVLTIVLISLDRYWLVRKQLKYVTFQTRRRVISSLACAWCACVIFYATLAFGWTALSGLESSVDYEMECEMEFSYSIPMTVAVNVVEFILPFCTIVFLNLAVYCSIRNGPKELVHRRVQSIDGRSYISVSFHRESRKSSPVARANIPVNGNHGDDEQITCVAKQENNATELVNLAHKTDYSTINTHTNEGGARTEESSRGYHLKLPAHHRKAAFLLAVLVGMFLLCWLPYHITSIQFAFCGDCVSELTWEITNNLLWCNSAVNPFLYAVTNVRFKDNFRVLLCPVVGVQRQKLRRASGHFVIHSDSPH